MVTDQDNSMSVRTYGLLFQQLGLKIQCRRKLDGPQQKYFQSGRRMRCVLPSVLRLGCVDRGPSFGIICAPVPYRSGRKWTG